MCVVVYCSLCSDFGCLKRMMVWYGMVRCVWVVVEFYGCVFSNWGGRATFSGKNGQFLDENGQFFRFLSVLLIKISPKKLARGGGTEGGKIDLF